MKSHGSFRFFHVIPFVKLTMVRLRHSLHLSLKEWYEERKKEHALHLFHFFSLHNMTLRLLSEEISIINKVHLHFQGLLFMNYILVIFISYLVLCCY